MTKKRRYEVKHLGFFISLLEKLKAQNQILEDEINFYIKFLHSLNFNQTYEIKINNVIETNPEIQVYDMQVNIGKFSFLICVSIDKALSLIKQNRLRTMRVPIQKLKLQDRTINADKLYNVDLSKPLIGTEFGFRSEYRIIDGTHRAFVAQNLHYENLQTYCLNQFEFLQCIVNQEIIPLYVIYHNYCALYHAFNEQSSDGNNMSVLLNNSKQYTAKFDKYLEYAKQVIIR